jgi:hypothetical protein
MVNLLDFFLNLQHAQANRHADAGTAAMPVGSLVVLGS